MQSIYKDFAASPRWRMQRKGSKLTEQTDSINNKEFLPSTIMVWLFGYTFLFSPPLARPSSPPFIDIEVYWLLLLLYYVLMEDIFSPGSGQTLPGCCSVFILNTNGDWCHTTSRMETGSMLVLRRSNTHDDLMITDNITSELTHITLLIGTRQISFITGRLENLCSKSLLE